MSEQELQHRGVSEDTSGEDKLVPVAEAIRYRRRAQQAEKELAEMKAERDQLLSEKQEMSMRLGEIQQDQQIREALAGAGAVDPETAALLVNSRLESADEDDVQAVIGQLQKDKGYLFCSKRPAGGTTR